MVNARFVKPLDRSLLLSHAAVVPLLVTMEDHVLAGGFGSAVLEALQEARLPGRGRAHRLARQIHRARHQRRDPPRGRTASRPADIYRRVLDRWRNLSAERVEAGV